MKFIALIRNQSGMVGGLVLVILCAVVFMGLLGTYESFVRIYQRRHGILKQQYELLEASEALAIHARQALDVANLAPKIADVPQCPLLAGVGTAPAEPYCFKATGACAANEMTYFCWPDPADPDTSKSRCITREAMKDATDHVTYCFGNDTGSGGRDNIMPVQTIVRYTTEPTWVAELREANRWKWSDIFIPLHPLILPEGHGTDNIAGLLLPEAMAAPVMHTAGTSTMDTTDCAAGVPVERCKTCTAEKGCLKIAICPVMYEDAVCQADLSLRFMQNVLFTN